MISEDGRYKPARTETCEMDATALLKEYRNWQRFSRQESLDREHRAAVRKLAQSGAMASRMAESYRSMASRGASEGACYRTLFKRRMDDETELACEGWLFVRRVLSEGGTTRVRATLLESFTLPSGTVTPGTLEPQGITLKYMMNCWSAKACRWDVESTAAMMRMTPVS
ncbi:hypothetical protein [Kushneria phosphatilytica]|uniref:hypothetical protein n=1 Tax=Kushneria phosphatilytica TaxID=657387 RepID=UPI0030B858FC